MIKLVFEEQGSDLAEELWDRAELVASSRLIYPEARAAAAMAHRTGRIDARALRNAARAIDRLHAQIRVIGMDDPLAQLAGELAERHGLRGYDAVHLASMISIEDPDLLTATWNDELAAATLACGRAVAPI